MLLFFEHDVLWAGRNPLRSRSRKNARLAKKQPARAKKLVASRERSSFTVVVSVALKESSVLGSVPGTDAG